MNTTPYVDLLSLIGADTPLKRVAGTGGGEYAGPCPFCGGVDRLRVQPQRRRWWCRQCSDDERWSDAIAYLRRRDGLSFREALDRLGGAPSRPPALGSHLLAHNSRLHSRRARLPSRTWHQAASEVAATCAAALLAAAGRPARDYLAGRGISTETAAAWGVGYNSTSRVIAGLWVEAGIVLPWRGPAGELCSLKVRRRNAQHRQRYTAVRGSVPLLYGVDRLSGRDTVVLCEGELDALLLWQDCGREAAPVAVCSPGAARPSLPDDANLALAGVQRIAVAYDADPAGDAAAARLLAQCPRMRRLRVPRGKDIGEFRAAGGDLRDWLGAALASPAPGPPR